MNSIIEIEYKNTSITYTHESIPQQFYCQPISAIAKACPFGQVEC